MAVKMLESVLISSYSVPENNPAVTRARESGIQCREGRTKGLRQGEKVILGCLAHCRYAHLKIVFTLSERMGWSCFRLRLSQTTNQPGLPNSCGYSILSFSPNNVLRHSTLHHRMTDSTLLPAYTDVTNPPREHYLQPAVAGRENPFKNFDWGDHLITWPQVGQINGHRDLCSPRRTRKWARLHLHTPATCHGNSYRTPPFHPGKVGRSASWARSRNWSWHPS